MLGQSSKDRVHSTTCQFKATLSRLGDGQGLAEAVGVHLGVPEHFRMQLDMGSMLVLFSLGSSQRVQGFWQGGDNSMVGEVTRGGTTFF